MKLQELINRHYDDLTPGDHQVLDYLLKHQADCSEWTSGQIAAACHISRTTLLRLCRKLDFDTFSELKYLLKTSSEPIGQTPAANLDIDDACRSYHRMIDDIRSYEYTKVCASIHKAETIYIYGTGNAQKAEAEEFKRIFLSAGKCVIDLYDFGEVELAKAAFTKQDLFLIISLSGETKSGIEILKTIESTEIPTLSITRWDNNTIARMCESSLYAGTKTLLGYHDLSYEMTASFYVLLDLLFVNYLEYVTIQGGMHEG